MQNGQMLKSFGVVFVYGVLLIRKEVCFVLYLLFRTSVLLMVSGIYGFNQVVMIHIKWGLLGDIITKVLCHRIRPVRTSNLN